MMNKQKNGARRFATRKVQMDEDGNLISAGKLVYFNENAKGRSTAVKVVFEDMSEAQAQYLLFHHRDERVAHGIRAYPTGVINNSELKFNGRANRNELRDFKSYDICVEMDTRMGGPRGTIQADHAGNLLAKVCRIAAGDDELPTLEKNTQGERYADDEDLRIFGASEVSHNDQQASELVF